MAYLGLFTYPAMQRSTVKNTTQQELFNIIETPLGTDFLVNRVIPNVTLLKCMCKAVYYTKKIRRSFSISHNLHTSMVEGK